MRTTRAWLLAFIAVTALLSCGPSASQSPPPQTAGAATMAADAGLPPPKSSRRGVIVPSDTGLGATPSGSAPSTGTTGRGSVGPTLGNPGNN